MATESEPSAPKVGVAAGNRGKGRKKGVPNKTTKACKEALQLAFDGIGGVPALCTWAAENRTDFYKLWTKLVPQEVKTELTGELKNSTPVINLTVTRADAES